MSAKDIQVRPISSQDAARIIKACHYSGKVVQNSQLHFGIFLDGKCGGAMQFGPSLDKRRMKGLVEGTSWNGFIELNRMAFAEWLPRNSESRAIAVAMRLIRKSYPHIEWVVSFADATQCGDGTIYRASGFVLTSIKKNQSLWEAPNGERFSETSLKPGIGGKEQIRKAEKISRAFIGRDSFLKRSEGESSMKRFFAAGWVPLAGYQLRYVYFLNKAARERLTVPIIPFSEIKKRGASMYRGRPPSVQSIDSDASSDQLEEGGVSPTCALQGAAHG